MEWVLCSRISCVSLHKVDVFATKNRGPPLKVRMMHTHSPNNTAFKMVDVFQLTHRNLEGYRVVELSPLRFPPTCISGRVLRSRFCPRGDFDVKRGVHNSVCLPDQLILVSKSLRRVEPLKAHIQWHRDNGGQDRVSIVLRALAIRRSGTDILRFQQVLTLRGVDRW